MKRPKVIIAIILVILVVIVLAQNAESTEVKFLFWEFSASAFVMYLIFFVIGAAAASIGMLWRRL